MMFKEDQLLQLFEGLNIVVRMVLVFSDTLNPSDLFGIIKRIVQPMYGLGQNVLKKWQLILSINRCIITYK